MFIGINNLLKDLPKIKLIWGDESVLICTGSFCLLVICSYCVIEYEKYYYFVKRDTELVSLNKLKIWS